MFTNASPLLACRPPCRARCPLHRAAVQQARRMRLEIPVSPSPVNGRGNIVTTSHKRIPFAFTREWGVIVTLIVFIVPLPFTVEGEAGILRRMRRAC